MVWADFDGVLAVRLARYDQVARDPNYGMVSNPVRPTPAEVAAWFGDLHRGMLDGRAVASVAEEAGRVVGLCTVRPEGSHVETRHVGVLGLEILDGFRGRGIGSKLLAHALDGCCGLFEEVHLAVLPVNTVAQRLYERQGFEVYGTAPRSFFRAGVYHDFLLMRKRID